MSESRENPRKRLTPEEVSLRKMDLSLRILVKMSDSDIRSEITRFQKEADKQLKIPKEKKRPKTAEEKKPDRVAERKWDRYHMELLPSLQLLAVIRDAMRVIHIRAIVQFTGNRKDLEAMGITVRSQSQDIFTITATKKQLLLLGAQAACHRLRAPRLLGHTVEQASAQDEIADVHNPRPLNPTGFRGNGIPVAVIDSCLDVTHHGFRDPSGTHGTRVLNYWVQSPYTLDANGNPIAQTPPGQTPEQFSAANPGTSPDFTGLNYGRIYTTTYIDTALGLSTSPYGTANNQICCVPSGAEHGTHCTGIATGSGHVSNWATAPTHIGAAPQATIIFVALQLLYDSFNLGTVFEDSLIDAIDFCTRAADFHGLPLVISVSQGGNLGPHNGSTDFDLARDHFLDSHDLRSILFAAGNDNSANGYRRGNVAAGGSIETFTMTFQAGTGWPVWVEIWYTGPELDYRIGYGGADSGWRTAGQDYTGSVGGRYIQAERDAGLGGGMRGIRIYSTNVNWGDIYSINLRNPHPTDGVNYYAWTGLQGWWADLNGPTHDELTMADTGCGRSILTVGACSKMLPPNSAAGELITDYSGAGPTVDGRIKPEIAAVGGDLVNKIISTASDQASGYTGMAGTSMATPLTAGAVALLLEEYGSLGYTLNQDTIKALLTQNANRLNLHVDPGQPGYVPTERNRYGYGRLRMIAPIDEVMPPLDVDVWIRTADDDYGQEPYPGDCCWCSPDIKVCQTGTNTEIWDINWGTTYDVIVTVRNLGDSDAVGSVVRLYYTQPGTAPSAWFWAEDAADNKLEQTVTVNGMGQITLTFHWRPQAAEIPAPAGVTHFCLLAEVDHVLDPIVWVDPTATNAWLLNVVGTNNVALNNLNIY